ncbi:uncharacterized protein corto [Fopius arisanus]|uniref:Uncharacterized protein corto n=2 Tax=Fopius arisanus TaxID=64838 RepID=A0A9R1U4D7_9HYME|nr:PREDICTED: uncharacterized protein LOC105268640 [Fopius arisanus]
MAAACYEKEISIESMSLGTNAHHFHHHHHHHQRVNGNPSTPVSTSRPGTTGQTILSPTASEIVIPTSPYKNDSFKDYAQPLHVDCSVEYELPSQAKPPPGGGEPLLMIHPCYYRRAERERRSPFVNNLPPMGTSVSSRKSRGRDSVHPARTGGDAGAVMSIATATAAVTTTSSGNIHIGDALTASSPSINTLQRRIRLDDCSQETDIMRDDKKRINQQRNPVFTSVPVANPANLTTADEKAVISGIYQHYFRAMRSHQPHIHQEEHGQVTQQHHHIYDDHVGAASPAPATFLQNFQVPAEPVSTTTRRRSHPYRRGCSGSRGNNTGGINSSGSSVYATAMNRHREASLQALRMAAAAVAAAAAAATGGNGATTGGFYEAPAYRALLPRS